MGNVLVFDHPLIQHKVTLMRKTETNNKEFRELAKEVVTLMGYEATRNLPLMDVEIETPICKTTQKMLKGEDIAIVPICRRDACALSEREGWSCRPLQRP